MLKRLILFIIVFLSIAPYSAFAQTELEGLESSQTRLGSSQTRLESSQTRLGSCFNYYDYGKVRAHLGLDKASFAPTETGQLRGTVINENTFPLVDVVLYAHLKRVNRSETFAQNGHFLVDRLKLADNLNFLPGETKAIEVDLPLRMNYPDGEYQLQYFLFSKHGFHYSGRPFLEEDTAGYSSFKIEGGKEPQVYFNIDSLQVGGEAHNLRELINEFRFGPLPITVGVVDNRGDQGDSAAPPLTSGVGTSLTPDVLSAPRVRFAYYKFEDTLEENMVLEREIREGLALETVFFPPEPGAYVFVAEIDEPVRTMFKYRFAVAGEKAAELRMNDLGVTDFPAKKESRAWVCFHSPTNNATPPTQATLELLDDQKSVIDTATITQEFTSEVMAISLGLTKLTTTADFWLRAKFVQTDNPSKSREVEIHYDCGRFADSLASFDPVYNEDARAITFGGRNVCGEASGRGGYVESVRIKHAGEIQKEEYNLASPEQLVLADLPPGTYTAQIKGSTGRHEFDFTVLPQFDLVERGIPILWLGVLVAGLGGLIVYLWVKRGSREEGSDKK